MAHTAFSSALYYVDPMETSEKVFKILDKINEEHRYGFVVRLSNSIDASTAHVACFKYDMKNNGVYWCEVCPVDQSVRRLEDVLFFDTIIYIREYIYCGTNHFKLNTLMHYDMITAQKESNEQNASYSRTKSQLRLNTSTYMGRLFDTAPYNVQKYREDLTERGLNDAEMFFLCVEDASNLKFFLPEANAWHVRVLHTRMCAVLADLRLDSGADLLAEDCDYEPAEKIDWFSLSI